MTTTVKVHVNGKYRATVVQDDKEPVTVEGNYNGGSGEKSFYLPHPAKGTFVVSEEQVADGDERQVHVVSLPEQAKDVEALAALNWRPLTPEVKAAAIAAQRRKHMQ